MRGGQYVAAGSAGVWSIYNVNPTYEVAYLENSRGQAQPPTNESWYTISSIIPPVTLRLFNLAYLYLLLLPGKIVLLEAKPKPHTLISNLSEIVQL